MPFAGDAPQGANRLWQGEPRGEREPHVPVGSAVRGTAGMSAAAGEADVRHSGPRAVGPSGLVSVRGRRRPWLIAVGVLISAAGVLITVWLIGSVGHRDEILVISRDVAYGQTISDEDLSVARVSADPVVRTVPATSRSWVVGRVASVSLSAGMVLTSTMTDSVGEPRPSRVLVPLALPGNRMPVSGLRPGDPLLVVDGSQGGAPIPAVVVAVGEPDLDGAVVVDLTTEASSGPRLAAAALNGQSAVIRQPVSS